MSLYTKCMICYQRSLTMFHTRSIHKVLSNSLQRQYLKRQFRSVIKQTNCFINKESSLSLLYPTTVIHTNLSHIARYYSDDNTDTSEDKTFRTSKEIFQIDADVIPDKTEISKLFVPLPPTTGLDKIDCIGAELVGTLRSVDVQAALINFYHDQDVRELALENGLDDHIYELSIISFRKLCMDAKHLPTDLHIILSDLQHGTGHTHDLFPFFMRHAHEVFPHIHCMDDLYKISDLTSPPMWFPLARKLKRRIIYHSGPTNSGKTYEAIQSFMKSESAIYCGPLKLLAMEVFGKCNTEGTPCDLMTGEGRVPAPQFNKDLSEMSFSEEFKSGHMSSTVEMTSVSEQYDVAVIDEIQMMRNTKRGWAWTRALLGICAKELHVCGEKSAIAIVKELAAMCGDTFELRSYERLTPLSIETEALKTLSNVQPGDCIVCFNKANILSVSRTLERHGHEVAVIYGALPPGTKLGMAAKFNNPDASCKIMVATDAIGMGLNLNIRRIIFYSLKRLAVNEKGIAEHKNIDVSSALQIGGRAGRYNTNWSHGYVTCMEKDDLPLLNELFSASPEPVQQGGLMPTADQIEMFAWLLPHYSLSKLIDIFINLCKLDSSLYFMCLMDDFKYLADVIQHINLDLRARYVFCCAPINIKEQFIITKFIQMVRLFSQKQAVTGSWLKNEVNWSTVKSPETYQQLRHLENLFDVFDIYLWLSYRFVELFPDADVVQDLQTKLDKIILCGISNITNLLKMTNVQSDDIDGKGKELKQFKRSVRMNKLIEGILYRKGDTKQMENLDFPIKKKKHNIKKNIKKDIK